jgi:hypothetical protein
MGFKQFAPEMVITGAIGRVGKHAAGVLTTDPVNMADLMNNSTYAWSTTDGWSDLGATEGGINITHGFATTGYKVDQSDGDFRKTVTDNTYKIATQLAHVGDLDTFEEAWLAGATLDNSSPAVLRVYYFREAELDSGDSQLSLTEDGLQVLPATWTAFPSTSATAQREFGFIMEDDGFGGVVNP